ncbi:MAG: DUF922 domain-containing protein [Pseudomonadota bacterium]
MCVLRRLFACLAFAVALSAGTSAHAVVVYDERLHPFDIGANISTRGDIWNAIRRYGPSEYSSGTVTVGRANWRVGYSYAIEPTRAGTCSFKTLKVDVRVIINIPKWDFASTASQETQDFFACVKRTVTVHEERHADIARRAGERIEAQMRRRLSNTSCDDFKPRAKAVFDSVYKQGAAEQQEFDRRDYAKRRYQACWDRPNTSARDMSRMSRRWTSITSADHKRRMASLEADRAYSEHRRIRRSDTQRPRGREIATSRPSPDRERRHQRDDDMPGADAAGDGDEPVSRAGPPQSRGALTIPPYALAMIAAAMGVLMYVYYTHTKRMKEGAAAAGPSGQGAGSTWEESALKAVAQRKSEAPEPGDGGRTRRSERGTGGQPRASQKPAGFGKRKPGLKR